MYRSQRTSSLTEDRFLSHAKTPSFSSSLLDQIYRSIDEGDTTPGEMNLYPETLGKKPSRICGKQSHRSVQEEEMESETLRRDCIMDKWMDKKIAEKLGRPKPKEMDKKLRRRQDRVSQDALFFSSTSSSSDSSYGGFSSSDTESMFGVGSGASCFAPVRPKPVRTTVSEKKERRHSSQIYGHREVHTFDHDYRQNPNTTTSSSSSISNEGLIKSKSRALKIYNNLKKVKQPISPGGRLTNFLNSLFTTGNTKKSKSTCEDMNAERKSKSGQASVSACSSASSFSRSCLSKTSPSSRHKLRDGVQRSVRFCPVSVIVDEESRPCGQKFLYEQRDHQSVMMPAVSVPTAWKIGRSPPTCKKNDNGETKLTAMEKSRRVEESGREILIEYLQNQKKKSDFTLMDLPLRRNGYEDEDEDDAASYSSSDLFELDHLAVMENRFREELPVYETTHVRTNRAIANGLIM